MDNLAPAPSQVPPAGSPALSPWAEPSGPRMHTLQTVPKYLLLGRSLCGSRGRICNRHSVDLVDAPHGH